MPDPANASSRTGNNNKEILTVNQAQTRRAPRLICWDKNTAAITSLAHIFAIVFAPTSTWSCLVSLCHRHATHGNSRRRHAGLITQQASLLPLLRIPVTGISIDRGPRQLVGVHHDTLGAGPSLRQRRPYSFDHSPGSWAPANAVHSTKLNSLWRELRQTQPPRHSMMVWEGHGRRYQRTNGLIAT